MQKAEGDPNEIGGVGALFSLWENLAATVGDRGEHHKLKKCSILLFCSISYVYVIQFNKTNSKT